MIVRRMTCILLLAVSTTACGDDSAARDCQQPGRDPKRQAAACTQVIAADPKSAKAYNNRCFAYNEQAQYEKSLADCNMSIKLDPRDASAYNNRGVAYEMRGELGSNYAASAQDASTVREVRVNLVTRTRMEDREWRQGVTQAKENRADGVATDGFRRRTYTSTVMLRNVGSRSL